MASISVKHDINYGQDFSEKEKVSLDKKDITEAFEVGLEILDKLGELERLIEVIHISFLQRFSEIVCVRFSVSFLQSKTGYSKDFLFAEKGLPGKANGIYLSSSAAKEMASLILKNIRI